MKYNFVELLLKVNEMRDLLVDEELIQKHQVELMKAYEGKFDLMNMFIDEIDVKDYEDQLNDYLYEIGEPLLYVMNDENLDDVLSGESPSNIIRMMDYGCFSYSDSYFSANGYELESFDNAFDKVDEDDFKRWLLENERIDDDDVVELIVNFKILFKDLYKLEELFKNSFEKELEELGGSEVVDE